MPSQEISFQRAFSRGLLAKSTTFTEVETGLYLVRTSQGTSFYVRADAWDMEDAVQRYGLRETRR